MIAAPDRRPLLSLQIALIVSWLGDAMTSLALPWFVLQTSGSVTQTGLSVVARTAGVYAATVLSGPYVDRFPTRPLVITSYLLAALAMVTIPILWWTDSLTFPLLLGATFAASVSQRPGFLALNRSLPEIAGLAGVSVERASGLNEMLYQTSLLVGPPLAGVLIAVTDSAWVLLLDAATFVVAAVVVAVAIPEVSSENAGLPTPKETTWSYRARMREGLAFLRNDAVLLSMMISVALGILLVNAPLLSVILQVYARESQGNSITLGFLFTCFGAGAVLGAAAFTWFGGSLIGRRLWIVAFLLTATPYLVIAIGGPTFALAVALLLFGLGEGLSTPMYAAVRFRRVPRRLRGRVYGALSPVTSLAPSLGLLVSTVLLDAFGVRGVAAVLLLGTAGVAVWLVRSPAIALLSDRAALDGPHGVG